MSAVSSFLLQDQAVQDVADGSSMSQMVTVCGDGRSIQLVCPNMVILVEIS